MTPVYCFIYWYSSRFLSLNFSKNFLYAFEYLQRNFLQFKMPTFRLALVRNTLLAIFILRFCFLPLSGFFHRISLGLWVVYTVFSSAFLPSNMAFVIVFIIKSGVLQSCRFNSHNVACIQLSIFFLLPCFYVRVTLSFAALFAC